MDRPTISSYVKQQAQKGRRQGPGPFVTISRQYGCDGYGIGQALVGRLNEDENQQQWRLFHKYFISELSKDTGVTEEIIERERLSRPTFIKDVVRTIRKTSTPDGFEIRNAITNMVRQVAVDGHAIIIGQGGAAATNDLENGINVRIEASKSWRISRISRTENLSRSAAVMKIEQADKQRKHLAQYYRDKNPRQPAFDLILDNAKFNSTQAAEVIFYALEQLELIEAK